jgi:hypothetical protein
MSFFCALKPFFFNETARCCLNFLFIMSIFISINVRTMLQSAQVLKRYFESNGVSCWICVDMDGGVDYRAEIVSAMKACKIFLPLMNAEWAASGECKVFIFICRILC